MTENPEQPVIDVIDSLVNESIDAGQKDTDLGDMCRVCGWPWHGLTGDGMWSGDLNCPGAFATKEQEEKYRADNEADMNDLIAKMGHTGNQTHWATGLPYVMQLLDLLGRLEEDE